MKKRLLAMTLVVLIVLSLLPTAAFAAGEKACTNHKWGGPETVREATCNPYQEGVVKQTCEKCGAVRYSVVPVEHKWSDEDNTFEATCTQPARTGKVCTICGAEGKMTPVEGSKRLGHDYIDTMVPATCTEDGYVVVTCSRCDYEAKENLTGALAQPATGHKWGKPTVVEPTCAEDGYTTRTCEVCKKTETYNQTPADLEKHDGVVVTTLKAATCTVNGLGRWQCSVCGADLGYKIIPAAHTWEYNITKAPTCKEAGEGTRTCTECGKEEKLDEQDSHVKITSDHTWTETGIVEATCTQPAKYGQVCSVCGATTKETVIIAGSKALGHAYQREYIDATCDKDAYILVTCERCEYKAEEKLSGELAKPATGHKFGEPTVVENTCSSDGYTMRVCSVCGKEEKTNVTPKDPNAHKWVVDNVLKEATCTETGIGRYECSVCGMSGGYRIIPVTPHVADPETAEITTEATCTEDGVLTFECRDCGASVTSPIHATGHSWGKDEVDETGYKVQHKCAICGEIEIVKNLCEHKNTKVEILTEATCTEPGSQKTVCADCGEILVAQEELPALGHTEEVIPGKEPTDTETGLTDGVKCSVCGEILVEQEELPATAHVHTEEVTPGKAATCTEAGLTEGKKCSVCGEVLVAQEEIPATGHNMVYSGYGFNDDGTAYFEHTCTKCGEAVRYNSTN